MKFLLAPLLEREGLGEGEPTPLSLYLPKENHTAKGRAEAGQRERVRRRGLPARERRAWGTKRDEPGGAGHAQRGSSLKQRKRDKPGGVSYAHGGSTVSWGE